MHAGFARQLRLGDSATTSTRTNEGIDTVQTLFKGNRRWARRTEERDPGFFSRLLEQQTPRYLWIGCADSRVPANEIVDLLPGEMFVHRNLANLVVHSDLNCLSVMQFAVDGLCIKHIIVVGHYGCGGVRAALFNQRVGLADNWFRHVQDVRNRHQAFLDGLPDDSTRLDALCELNVLQQALNVCQTTVVQDAWARGQSVAVHGLVYGLHDGLLKDLSMSAENMQQADAAHMQAIVLLKERYANTAEENRR